jgi:hypothetical protein
MSTPRYATREQVKRALDIAETARSNAQIDRALADATEAIHGLCHRVFYPTLATRYFDWPDEQMGTWYRLWLDASELISVTTLVSGGTTIAASDYLLEPQRYGPPYNRVEVLLSSRATLGGGNTWQRDITITGLFGYRLDEGSAGTLTAAVSSTTATTVNIGDSSVIGVGDLIRVDDERMLVTGKRALTTGQTLQADLTASAAATTVAVTNGAAYAVDETILLDSETMLIVDIAGNNLIVRRAWDGSTLAAHTGSIIYAPRTLVVERGALGTTAATHANGTSVVRFDPPPLVKRLAIAEALVQLGLESAGYARTSRSGDGQQRQSYDAVGDLRDQVYTAHGRKTRLRAV